jgi:hypothetical protein
MFDDSEDVRQFSYWPSISDLFMTCFVITLVVLAAFCYIYRTTSSVNYKRVVDAVGGVELSRIKEPTNRMRDALKNTCLPEFRQGEPADKIVTGLSTTADAVVKEIERLRHRVNSLEGELNDKPPIIKIAEAGNAEYRFKSGKANVEPDFQKALRGGGFDVLSKEILRRNRAHPGSVDTLEIIGHTDGAAFSQDGNLDNQLPVFLAGGTREDLAKLTPGSNNDLGLIRALAIKMEWRDFVEQTTDQANKEDLKKIDIRCYSAGQTIPEGFKPGDAKLLDPNLFKKENAKFRRIEIRLTKLGDN